jgi:membrane-associated phospholipid phosphatase
MIRINFILLFLTLTLTSVGLKANWDSPNFLTNQNSKSLKVQQRIGDVGVIALNLFALGLIIQNEDTEGFKQYAYSGLSTATFVVGGKNLTKRERPDGSDTQSFPSGHSAFSFMSATFITQRYGNKYALSTYLVASFVAYSRVASKKHYVSDAVVGGAIGALSATFFTKNYDININGNKHNLLIEPILTNKSFNLQLTLR